jgi:hypothetical protein
MSTLLKYIFLLLVTTTLIFTAYKAYENETAYVETTRQISTRHDTSKALQQRIDKLLEDLSLGLYDRYSKNSDQLEAMEQKAALLHQHSIRYFYYFCVTALVALLFFGIIDLELTVMFIGISALVALMTALFTPLVMMSVYKSIPFIGEITLSFESKSIYTTIEKLIEGRNYFTALLVLLFSVVIPLFKALVLTLYGFFKESGMAKKSVKVIEKIGKWSMADVFIVALLVVLFSTKQDIHTSMQIETGFYFFTGYVLLSMLGSVMLNLTQKRES